MRAAVISVSWFAAPRDRMKRSINEAKRLAPALVLAACLIAAPSARAFQRETTDDPPCSEAPGVNCGHRGRPLSWSARPVAYFINTAGSGLGLDVVLPAVQAAFSTWQSASSDRITFQFAGQSQEGPDGQDGRNTVSWQRLSNARDVFAQSIITFRTNSGEIFDVDIELNDAFTFAVLPDGENDPSDSRVDVQAVVTHEAGHLLGLDHENRFGSRVVMFFEDTRGNTTHRTLADDDRNGVRAVYGGGGGGGGGGGCAIARSADRSDLLTVALCLCWLAARRRSAPAHGRTRGAR